MRYRILYDKRGLPLTAWRDTLAESSELAQRLRLYGYSVDVWEVSPEGARPLRV